MKTRTILILYLIAVVFLTLAAPVRYWDNYLHIWRGGGRETIWGMGSYYALNTSQFLLELGLISLVAGVIWLIGKKKA